MAGHHAHAEDLAGDPFKSEGERQIARLLERLDVPYRYEHPLAVLDRGKGRTWYPDFLLPEYGIILEYAGMGDSESYERTLRHKKEVYDDLGVSVIYVEPADFSGFWPRRLAERIKTVLAQRLETFRARTREGFGRPRSGRRRQASVAGRLIS